MSNPRRVLCQLVTIVFLFYDADLDIAVDLAEWQVFGNMCECEYFDGQCRRLASRNDGIDGHGSMRHAVRLYSMAPFGNEFRLKVLRP